MFCGNCGNKLDDDVKFCGNCGQPVGGDDENCQASVQTEDNKQAPATEAQAPVVAPQTDAQVQNNNQPVTADAQAPVVITQPGKKPKKKKTGLIIACVVIGVLIIIGIVVAIVFATNSSQTTNDSAPSSTKALASTVDNSSKVDAKFDLIIKENEQLKAWWDCEYYITGPISSSSKNNHKEDLDYVNKKLQSLTNFYPDINVTTASPSKYAKIDLNSDGQDELVVMGKGAYSAEVILGIYYYDASDKQVKMLKVTDSDFLSVYNSWTEVVCPDGIIKSKFKSSNESKITLYKMEGDSLNNVGEYNEPLGKNRNKTDESKQQLAEFKNIDYSHEKDESIEWSDFESVDPVYSFVGTVKLQTSYERMTDPNSRSEYMDIERNDESINSPYYDKDTKLIVFERDEGEETPCINGDHQTITSRNAIAYLLADGSKRDTDIETTDSYQKLSGLIGKKVMITINMKKMSAPTGVTGWGIDLYGKDDNVVSVSPM